MRDRTASQTPLQWDATFSAGPIVSSDAGCGLHNGLLRRWTGTDPLMPQPALDHHYIALHLGGGKQVQRRGEGSTLVKEVVEGSITFAPANASFRWTTYGPIDFAHIYFKPAWLSQIIGEDFDREPRALMLREPIGHSEPLLAALFLAMLDEAATPQHPDGLYIDTLYRALLVRFLHLHSEFLMHERRWRHALSPYKLRILLEYIDANIAADLDLCQLASVANLSPYHFSRAFKSETGSPPYAFVLRRRTERGKELLRKTNLPVEDIARCCGFKSTAQFCASFKRATDRTPRQYRSALA